MKSENLPTISNYGYYSSDNYGSHSMKVSIPRTSDKKHGITLYYSYNTLVAFRGFINSEKQGLFVIKNYWGTTTGKHLNFIDGGDKKSRLTESDFIKLFNKALRNA